MALAPAAMRRLAKELVKLTREPSEGIRVVVQEDDLLNLSAWIEGPAGTPYEGGYFKVRFEFGAGFPASPPKCRFVTKIFHPNVAPSTGEICVSTLKKDWKPEYGVEHIMAVVRCLLIYPNAESALNEEAGRQLIEAYEDYARHAKLMSGIHAASRPVEFSAVASTSKGVVASAANQLSGGAGRANSMEPVSYPSLPLQASASGNGASAEPSSPGGTSKKRTVTVALGPSAASAGPAVAPEAVARKPLGAGGAAPGKKRGLKRL